LGNPRDSYVQKIEIVSEVRHSDRKVKFEATPSVAGRTSVSGFDLRGHYQRAD
jgi:hypothetical protein